MEIFKLRLYDEPDSLESYAQVLESAAKSVTVSNEQCAPPRLITIQYHVQMSRNNSPEIPRKQANMLMDTFLATLKALGLVHQDSAVLQRARMIAMGAFVFEWDRIGGAPHPFRLSV